VPGVFFLRCVSPGFFTFRPVLARRRLSRWRGHRYECSGPNCKSEHLGRIERKYPDIAYVLYDGEGDLATRASASQVTFRRFSDDCSP